MIFEVKLPFKMFFVGIDFARMDRKRPILAYPRSSVILFCNSRDFPLFLFYIRWFLSDAKKLFSTQFKKNKALYWRNTREEKLFPSFIKFRPELMC